MIRIGIDIGSTTVKVVALDEQGQLLYKDYQRHHSRSRETAAQMLTACADQIGEQPVLAAMSGSAALKVSEAAGLPFVQEVFATRRACDVLTPGVDVVIELGGEDAKILFLTGGLEERMNSSCAGGTGAFIDQMAALLNVSLQDLDALSLQHTQIYPIASRCGVFAKSDIQPLLNQGAAKADVAASIYQSIVSQTIAGLAQGRDIKGTVCFLGGPLTFLQGLRERFTETLELDRTHAVFPQDAAYFPAIGAALNAPADIVSTPAEICGKLLAAKKARDAGEILPPLFVSHAEYQAFAERHAKADVALADIAQYSGKAWLGIDAGSTTTKLALVGSDGELLYTYYAPNKGDPIAVCRAELLKIRAVCGERIRIRGAACTGYGEELLKAAFRADFGIVETTAHYTAAKRFLPNVDFIIDIGGQDMKCFKLKAGVVESILLNEACSSGCGSFIESFAAALGYSAAEFAKIGLFAESPVNLGSRCTVFMNSSVKQAQNNGASVGDISAGLSVSVVKNAVYKVIRANSAADLGQNIVVQGGTFLSDAVLRAFEREIGHDVVRPAIAGLMGAYGAALYAKEQQTESSTLLTAAELEAFTVHTKPAACGLCGNNCKLNITTFNDGSRHISGNRCSRPLGKKADALPDAYAYKQRCLTAMNSTVPIDPSGTIGIPLGLGAWELFPFWKALLEGMGFHVVHSGFSTRELYLEGQHTIPSDTVCYPAKLVHGHVLKLIRMGIKTIFFPCLPYNFDEHTGDNHYNCPVVAFYPELLAKNVPELERVNFLYPFLAPHAETKFPKLAADYFAKTLGVYKSVAKAAAQNAYAAYEAFRQEMFAFGERTLREAKEKGQRVVILAGRPYHTDPEVNHGMNQLLVSLGCAVLSEDCIPPLGYEKRTVLNQWTYHARLYNAARFVANHPEVEFVQLVSFGCGLDAITTDEVKDILERAGKVFTMIKIDEVNNLGAAKIRLRSLLEATGNARKEVLLHG
ncbi:MAG: acyl-CoA dehydratase activase-related protein [Oscillospiraceae bacterium]|jgi:predicted CoA-substrate-specific enzyme activase|nr:acyl-CoA dehydratase activase-related protein [Oscillospiraceae bacterium]